MRKFALTGAFPTKYRGRSRRSCRFRLTQNDNAEGVVKKNGTHRIDKRDPRKNILGSTKGAEAVRLFFRGFRGDRVRFAAPTVTDSRIPAAARDAYNTHTVMVTN